MCTASCLGGTIVAVTTEGVPSHGRFHTWYLHTKIGMFDSWNNFAAGLVRVISHTMMGVLIAINTLRLRQNGRHFTDNIFKCIFLNENFRILIRFSLKFVLKGPIHNKSALIQVMACYLFSTKPLPETMLMQFTDAYMHHLAPMS